MKKKNKLNFKVLDCTLRDGGYYNNWNFSDKIVNEYVSSINQSGIDVVEIGFRFLKKNNNGTFANTKEETINNLKIKKNVDLALMINSSDFDNSKNYKSQIRRYFLPRKQSKISIIRLATHLKDLNNIRIKNGQNKLFVYFLYIIKIFKKPIKFFKAYLEL